MIGHTRRVELTLWRACVPAGLGVLAGYAAHLTGLLILAGYFGPRAPISATETELHGNLLIALTLSSLILLPLITTLAAIRTHAGVPSALLVMIALFVLLLYPYHLIFESFYPDVTRS